MAEKVSPEGYAAAGGSCCPYCGSEAVTRGRLRLEGTCVVQPVACLPCRARWDAVYELAGYEGEQE